MGARLVRQGAELVDPDGLQPDHPLALGVGLGLVTSPCPWAAWRRWCRAAVIAMQARQLHQRVHAAGVDHHRPQDPAPR
jgi:hypothetical protein